MILADQLKFLIRKKGLTVIGLSKGTGVPAKTLYSWLQKQSPRNLDQLRAISDFFDVSLEYLLFGENAKKKTAFDEFKDEINAGTYEVILRKTIPRG